MIIHLFFNFLLIVLFVSILEYLFFYISFQVSLWFKMNNLSYEWIFIIFLAIVIAVLGVVLISWLPVLQIDLEIAIEKMKIMENEFPKNIKEFPIMEGSQEPDDRSAFMSVIEDVYVPNKRLINLVGTICLAFIIVFKQ